MRYIRFVRYAGVLVVLCSCALAQKQSSIIQCATFPGPDAGSKISACIAALPASGGTADARGITGDQKITTDIFDHVAKPGVLLLGNARYELSGQSACFNIPSNWTIEGVQGYGSILAGTGYCKQFNNRIVVTTGSNIILRGFKVEGRNALGEQCVALLNGAHDVKVQGVWADSCGQFGLLVGDTGRSGGFANIEMINNIVTNVGEPASETNIGIEVFPQGPAGFRATGLVIRHNRVTGKSGGKLACGIKMNAAVHPVIEDNLVDLRTINVTPSSGGGICLVTSEDAVITKNRVQGAKNGIAVSGIVDPRNGLRNHNVSVEENQVSDQTENGIYSAEGFQGLTIVRNTFKRGEGKAARGVFLQKSTQSYENAHITDNEISAYGTALDVDSPGAKPDIVRNKINSGNVVVR